jgi:hypothetical protein
MRISIAHVFGVTAIAALACTGMAQAQEHGTFHLATEAHWGKAVLEPGDYRMVLPDPSLRQFPFRIEGSGHMIFALPLLTDFQAYSHSSYLKLVNVDGSYFVREFSSGVTGKAFTFSVPRPSRRQITVSSADNTIDVAVR